MEVLSLPDVLATFVNADAREAWTLVHPAPMTAEIVAGRFLASTPKAA